MAMSKLRSVDEQQMQSLAKQIVLFFAPPSGAAVSFGATLLAAQAAGATAGISCATPVLASLMGSIALCTASAASAQVSYSLRKLCSPEYSSKKEYTFLSKDNLVVNALFGVIAFKLLGGNCRNLMPSSVVNPGALGRASVPARGAKYANEREQGLIQDLFRKYGCHHCDKRAGDSIADHMPPNVVAHGRGWAKASAPTGFNSFFSRLASTFPSPALAPKVVQQRLYPQCTDCMKIQSVALRHGKTSLVLHFKRGIPEAPYFTGFCIGAMNLDGLRTRDGKKSG